MTTIGTHKTWDVYACNEHTLSFVPPIEDLLHEIIDALKLEKVSAAFKQFEPIGVTGFILLAESHISIHTWPEHGYAAIDVFSCKPFDASIVERIIEKRLETTEIITNSLERGHIKTAANIS